MAARSFGVPREIPLPRDLENLPFCYFMTPGPCGDIGGDCRKSLDWHVVCPNDLRGRTAAAGLLPRRKMAQSGLPAVRWAKSAGENAAMLMP
jgi:hypothetical protein